MENVSSKIHIPDREASQKKIGDWDLNGPIPLGKLSPIPNLNSEVMTNFIAELYAEN
jgi:hypothetical protein